MNHLDRKPKVTILTPVYNEAESLPLYVNEVKESLFSVAGYDFEILFIDDGSADRSWLLIQEICRQDSRFRGLRLSRNFGSHIALCAGFEQAHGDAVCVLACDLQDPPETILEFLKTWEKGAKIVWGKRRTRHDVPWRILASQLFTKILQIYAMPKGSQFTTGSFLLADRKVAECFRQFRERNRITFALMAWSGFEQAVVEYDRRKRKAGVSGWGFWQMVKTVYDGIMGFSLLPIRLMTLLGLGVFCLTSIFLAYLFWNWLSGNPLTGWTSVMLSSTFFFGLLFLVLGIVGEYLYRIYAEVVRRPLYFISDQINIPPA